MELTDTHCHIQFADYPLDVDEVIQNAVQAGVNRMLVVGCDLPNSAAAPEFAARYENVWASIGLHPHEAAQYADNRQALQRFRGLAAKPKVVAIGETGLDYYYEHSPRADQKKLFRYQLELALEHKLPLIFHVRDAAASAGDAGQAFDDFFAILDDYQGVQGVVHSFTSDRADLEKILSRGLYVGLNGIMTFTKRADQLAAAKAVPLGKLLLETDAPFLTPAPYRGKICEPKHVRTVAEFLADLRGEKLEDLAAVTTANARKLFSI